MANIRRSEEKMQSLKPKKYQDHSNHQKSAVIGKGIMRSHCAWVTFSWTTLLSKNNLWKTKKSIKRLLASIDSVFSRSLHTKNKMHEYNKPEFCNKPGFMM